MMGKLQSPGSKAKEIMEAHKKTTKRDEKENHKSKSFKETSNIPK